MNIFIVFLLLNRFSVTVILTNPCLAEDPSINKCLLNRAHKKRACFLLRTVYRLQFSTTFSFLYSLFTFFLIIREIITNSREKAARL